MSLFDRPTSPIEIFYSYSRKDERVKNKLKIHLGLLKQQGLITNWHDRNISAGKEWRNNVDIYLDSAQIILLLVSADFLASEYCYSVEIKRALERHEADEARVIPIILRPVDWHEALFSKLQVLPTNARPVTSSAWRNQDEAFSDVARGIRIAIEEINENTSHKASLPKQSNLKSPFLPTSEILKITPQKHILIVDDNYQSIASLEIALKLGTDYYVSYVDDGREGIAFAQRIHVDLIVLDLGMRRIGGIEFIEQLRRLGNNVPIIVVSGETHHRIIEEAINCGANAFMHKPFHPFRLVDLIKTFLDRIN